MKALSISEIQAISGGSAIGDKIREGVDDIAEGVKEIVGGVEKIAGGLDKIADAITPWDGLVPFI